MTIGKVIASQLEKQIGMLKMTLADFSDADAVVRPVPAANHVMWQLGHTATSEQFLMRSLMGDLMPDLPGHWKGKFSKEAHVRNALSDFVPLKEVIDEWTRVRQAGVDWTSAQADDVFAQPIDKRFAFAGETVADLVNMQVGHLSVHIGQFQVIRRALGKPILF